MASHTPIVAVSEKISSELSNYAGFGSRPGVRMAVIAKQNTAFSALKLMRGCRVEPRLSATRVSIATPHAGDSARPHITPGNLKGVIEMQEIIAIPEESR
jgi:hypothetical protein